MANDAFAALAHPTRREIVEAAERVMRERGPARSATKEIARAASY
jgi:AcrR family transcriptional regulator